MGHPRTIRMKADMVDKIDHAKIMEMHKTVSKMPATLLSSL